MKVRVKNEEARIADASSNSQSTERLERNETLGLFDSAIKKKPEE